MAQNKVEFDWIDAFSDRAFHGNGCAVVYFANHFILSERLAFVRETGLTECTFLENQNELWRIRYYLAGEEIPYAGHPTIASLWSLYKRGLIADECKFESGLGIHSAKIENGWVTIGAPIPEFLESYDTNEVAEIYGLAPEVILNEPQRLSSGVSFIITQITNQSALDRANLNSDKLAKFRKRHDLPAFCEPYLFTKVHSFNEQALTLGRLLMPPPNPKEDSFTGSATSMMAAWGYANSLLPKKFIHAQGHMLNRLGFAKLSLQGTPNSIQSLKMSGQAHILMSGALTK